jgi:hypothetical protein
MYAQHRRISNSSIKTHPPDNASHLSLVTTTTTFPSIKHAINNPTHKDIQLVTMKIFTILVGAVTMFGATVVAQDECHDRCNQFYTDCVNAGGTTVFCGALRGMFDTALLHGRSSFPQRRQRKRLTLFADSCLTDCT